MDWPQIINKLRFIKEHFDRSYKCLNTDRPTKEETVEKHTKILFERLEEIRVVLNVHYSRLTVAHKSAADNFFTDVRDKLVHILSRRGLEVKLPTTLHEKFVYCVDTDLPQVEPSSHSGVKCAVENTSSNIFETSTISTDNPTIMPQSLTEFLGLASKLLPEFDGKPENLNSFLDALSLVDSIKEGHETVAINLVRTKLKGNARNLVTNESTLISIIERLRSTVKGESTEVITAKIMNIKQNNKSANAYTAEIEELTKSLENAFLSDGLPPQTASKYAIRTAVKAMTKNCSHDRVKLVMEAGNYETMNDVVSKFVNCCTDVTGQNSVFQLRQDFRRGKYNGNNYRGRGQRGNRGRSNYRGRGRGNYHRYNYSSDHSRHDNRSGGAHQGQNNVRLLQQEDNRTENQQSSSTH